MRRRLFVGAGSIFLACSFSSTSRRFVRASEQIRVAVDTDYGRIIIEAYAEQAPLSTSDFLAYVDEGRYRGASFFRTVRLDNDRGEPKIEVIQATISKDCTARSPIGYESTLQTGLRHINGSVSLARSAIGTGSAASFFICVGDQPALDFGNLRNPDGKGFAVFGRVVAGIDIVRIIHSLPTDDRLGSSEYMKGQILANPVLINVERI